MRTTRRFQREVPEIPRSRHFVAEVLRSHGAEPTDEVLLVASELITNAVCHGNGDVELRVEIDAHSVRLEVLDEGHFEVAAPAVAPSPQALGGRGLALVREVARHWGAGFDAAGRTRVWAELPAGTNRDTP